MFLNKKTVPEVKPAPTKVKTLQVRGVDPHVTRAFKMIAISYGDTQAQTLARLISHFAGAVKMLFPAVVTNALDKATKESEPS